MGGLSGWVVGWTVAMVGGWVWTVGVRALFFYQTANCGGSDGVVVSVVEAIFLVALVTLPVIRGQSTGLKVMEEIGVRVGGLFWRVSVSWLWCTRS